MASSVTSLTPSKTSARRMRGPRLFLALCGVIVLIIVPTVVVPTVLFPPETPALDDHGLIPDVPLTDHTGTSLTRADLVGRVTIVNFIFTRCDSVCPVTSAKMRTVQDRTNDAGGDVKLLSISVDPAYDTVPRLAAYAERFAADPSRWRFARGEPADVRALVERGMQQGFDDLGGETRPGVPNITHSGHFVLLDRRGHVRGYYDSDDWPRIEKLMKHARYLARRPGA